MEIVFVSFIDSSNIGDLMIAEVLEEKLMSEHNVKKYSFNLIPEEEITLENQIFNKRKFEFINTIYNDYFRNIDIIDRIHLFKIKNRVDRNPYLGEFEEDIRKCDILVVGGGNAIFDLTKHSLSAYKINKILQIANKYHKKTFVTSIGIGPFKTQSQVDYTLNTLKKADFVSVRDKKSFNYVRSLNKHINKVYLSIDPVFLLKKKYEREESLGEKVISICIIDLLLNKDNKKKYNDYIINIVKIIEKLIENNYKINLFSTEPRDYRAVNEVYNKFKNNNNVVKVNINHIDQLLKLYAETDLILGTRMHSMIIGLSQLIPVIGISWQDKVKEMFEMVGSNDDVFDIEGLKNNTGNILELINSKLDSNKLTNNLKELKERSNEKFDINIEIFSKLIRDIPEELSNDKK